MRIGPVTAALLVTAIAVGLFAGIGGFTFVYARGGSYLSDDSAACMNCHVMRAQYDGWTRSRHHAVAGCNDCHTPVGFLDHWVVKATNGWHHSYAFTTGEFPEPMRITERNLEITEAACRHCHGDLVAQMDALASVTTGEPDPDDQVRCSRCHRSVGHAHAD